MTSMYELFRSNGDNQGATLVHRVRRMTNVYWEDVVSDWLNAGIFTQAGEYMLVHCADQGQHRVYIFTIAERPSPKFYRVT